MANLLEVIPHTGFGDALFPYLNEKDQENLKRTCKTLKDDVDEHAERSPPVPPKFALCRKNGILCLFVQDAKEQCQDVCKQTFVIEPPYQGTAITDEQRDQEQKRIDLDQAHDHWQRDNLKRNVWKRWLHKGLQSLQIHSGHNTIGPISTTIAKLNETDYQECKVLFDEIRPQIDAEIALKHDQIQQES